MLHLFAALLTTSMLLGTATVIAFVLAENRDAILSALSREPVTPRMALVRRPARVRWSAVRTRSARAEATRYAA